MTSELEPDAVSWRELHIETEAKLGALGFEVAPNEARWIVEEASGQRFEEVATQPATERRVAHLDAMVTRRSTGEPLQYVLGHWPFRSLDLMVDRRVLIPRQETEVVAGVAIDEVNRRGPGVRVADLGTGSGAIALSIAAECSQADVWATDRSRDALGVAHANCAGLGRRAAAVTLAEGSWFGALPDDLAGAFDVVVSNPPYVMTSDELPSAVEAWEPVDALRAGPDGLDDLRHLIEAVPEWLTPTGVLICEIDPRQAEAVCRLAASHGFARAEVIPDLSGRMRALVAHRE